MASILEQVAGSSDFDILEQAVVTAGLEDAVGNLDGATVFAPTDAAFIQTAVDLGYEGDLEDEAAVFGYLAGKLELIGSGDTIGALQAVLQYHISASELDSAAVTAADQITVLNGTIDSTVGAADLIDNDPDVTDPTIVTADIAADNGIVHAIDRVLLPLDVQTIDDLVNDGAGPDADGSDFDLLAAALSATGLSAVTSDPGQSLTVFAPTDAAFIGLAQSLGYNGSDEAGAIGYIIDVATVLGQGNPLPVIEDILLYHVVNGVLDSGDVVAADGTSITTALGADVGIALPELVDASNDFADPQLILTDLDNYAVNGIVHAIDGVLLPVNLDASTGISVGSDGADKVKGGKGVDLINAKAGNDKINGGKGADQIIAGAGNDKISGGKDADSFIFSDGDGADVIKDFGQDDRIVITSSAFELEDLGRNRWEITYGESDSIIVIGKGQVDIEVQIDLLVA